MKLTSEAVTHLLRRRWPITTTLKLAAVSTLLYSTSFAATATAAAAAPAAFVPSSSWTPSQQRSKKELCYLFRNQVWWQQHISISHDHSRRTLSVVAAAAASSTSSSDDNYESLRVPELKDMLRARGLKVSGKKSELIERLQQLQLHGEVVDEMPAKKKKKEATAVAVSVIVATDEKEYSTDNNFIPDSIPLDGVVIEAGKS